MSKKSLDWIKKKKKNAKDWEIILVSLTCGRAKMPPHLAALPAGAI